MRQIVAEQVIRQENAHAPFFLDNTTQLSQKKKKQKQKQNLFFESQHNTTHPHNHKIGVVGDQSYF